MIMKKRISLVLLFAAAFFPHVQNPKSLDLVIYETKTRSGITQMRLCYIGMRLSLQPCRDLLTIR